MSLSLGQKCGICVYTCITVWGVCEATLPVAQNLFDPKWELRAYQGSVWIHIADHTCLLWTCTQTKVQCMQNTVLLSSASAVQMNGNECMCTTHTITAWDLSLPFPPKRHFLIPHFPSTPRIFSPIYIISLNSSLFLRNGGPSPQTSPAPQELSCSHTSSHPLPIIHHNFPQTIHTCTHGIKCD